MLSGVKENIGLKWVNAFISSSDRFLFQKFWKFALTISRPNLLIYSSLIYYQDLENLSHSYLHIIIEKATNEQNI